MKCPVCSNLLQQAKTKSAIIDVCPACKGIWFDAGEQFVDLARSLSKSEDIPSEKLRLFEKRNVQTLKTIKEGYKLCPICSKELRKFNYSYDSNIFLDKCRYCGGIWTDGGEVRRIASYLKTDPRVVEIGKYFAEHVRKMEDAEDIKNLGEMLSSRVSPAVLFWPKIVVPLSDDTPRERFPAVTVSIIALCTLTFICQMLLVSEPEAFVRNFGFISGDFFSLGLITSMFLHGDILHLIFNMFFLWLFGDNIEDRFGHWWFIVFYFACDIFANILHSIFNWGSPIPAIGASGAISGIMGAYFIIYPTAQVKLFVVYRIMHIPASWYLGGWFFFQLMAGFLSKGIGVSDIAWFAHIGGFVFGGIVAYIHKRRCT